MLRNMAGSPTQTILVIEDEPAIETIETTEVDAQRVSRKRRRDRRRQWTYFPERLQVSGKILPSTRKRGLHEVRVYEFDAQLLARFDVRIPADDNTITPRRIGRPWLRYGISAVRGLAGTPRLRIGGGELPLEQGFGSRDGRGVHARLAAPRAGTRLVIETRLDMALGGIESQAIAPLGKRNRIVIESP